MEELGRRGIAVPKIPINNHPNCWCSDDADTTYILLTNVRVDSLERHDDHAEGGVEGFNRGPYKLPVLRPASMEQLPHIPGVVVYPTEMQQPTRKYVHKLEDLPPSHRVDITSNTVVHVESEWAARQAIAEFMVAAIDSFGAGACTTGQWSAYVGKHNDCAADGGHPDAFSRAFQMNGPAAEMTRTRSCIGYGPSSGPGRMAALLTIRNVEPGQSKHYRGLAARKAQFQHVTGRCTPHSMPARSVSLPWSPGTGWPHHHPESSCADSSPIQSAANSTGYKGVSKMRNGRFIAAIRLSEDNTKRCLGSFDTAFEAGSAYAVAAQQKRCIMLGVCPTAGVRS